jgi:hypothetical protein
MDVNKYWYHWINRQLRALFQHGGFQQKAYSGCFFQTSSKEDPSSRRRGHWERVSVLIDCRCSEFRVLRSSHSVLIGRRNRTGPLIQLTHSPYHASQQTSRPNCPPFHRRLVKLWMTNFTLIWYTLSHSFQSTPNVSFFCSFVRSCHSTE